MKRETTGMLPVLCNAVPSDVGTALFLGGRGRSWTEAVESLKRTIGDLDAGNSLSELLGPLGDSGLDMTRPASLGLVAQDGIAVFDAGTAIGMIGKIRSPVKWRTALAKAAGGKVHKLNITSARESGWARLRSKKGTEEPLEMFFARTPPFLYCLFGAGDRKEVKALLSSWCARGESEVLSDLRAMKEVAANLGDDLDALLWLNTSNLWSSSDDSTLNGAIASIIRPLGLGVGITTEGDDLLIKVFLSARGSLMNELSRYVSRSRTARISCTSLSKATKAWLLVLLDLGLVFRLAPSLAGELAKLISEIKERFKIGISSGTSIALGITSIHFQEKGDPDTLSGYNGFLIVQVLGDAMAAKAAGKGLDALGTIWGASKRFMKMGVDQGKGAVMTIGGVEVTTTWHKGCLILATDRQSLDRGVSVLDSSQTGPLPVGMLAGFGVKAGELMAQMEQEQEKQESREQLQGETPGGSRETFEWLGDMDARLYNSGRGFLLEVTKRR
ncbi:MAG: hypothetical protein GXP49_06725 [Deltaproteobacteria bacterium]|nr:hypothetical protein [Deltaproteobacteria bacterium]